MGRARRSRFGDQASSVTAFMICLRWRPVKAGYPAPAHGQAAIPKIFHAIRPRAGDGAPDGSGHGDETSRLGVVQRVVIETTVGLGRQGPGHPVGAVASFPEK